MMILEALKILHYTNNTACYEINFMPKAIIERKTIGILLTL